MSTPPLLLPISVPATVLYTLPPFIPFIVVINLDPTVAFIIHPGFAASILCVGESGTRGSNWFAKGGYAVVERDGDDDILDIPNVSSKGKC